MSVSLDLLGIGIGPSNLSVAALLHPVSRVRARFFDPRAAFDWHPGMMLPNARMQTSFLKDLVTPVAPTSPFSFVSYLVATGRLYRFINAEFSRIHRAEFAEYLQWASKQLPALSFGNAVREVRWGDGAFVVTLDDNTQQRAKDLSVGVGNRPNIPSWAERHVGASCFHSTKYAGAVPSLEGKRVVVVGGGQSGAELFLDAFGGQRGRAREVIWVTRRPNLEPLDETPFINEHFTPDYVREFHALPRERRRQLVDSQKLYTDGISPETLKELSQRFYEADFLEAGTAPYRVLPYREVRQMDRDGSGAFHLRVHNGMTNLDEGVTADVVLLATGYRFALPTFLDPIAIRLSRDPKGTVDLAEDYSAIWDGPAQNRIFMQNAARLSHGIADSALSLSAWRAGVIVNSVLGAAAYPVRPADAPLNWRQSSAEAPIPAPRESKTELIA